MLIQLAREGLARADAHGASPCLASEVLDPAEETERGERGTRNLAPRFLRTEVSPGAAGERKQKLGRSRAGLLIPFGKRIHGTIRKIEKRKASVIDLRAALWPKYFVERALLVILPHCGDFFW